MSDLGSYTYARGDFMTQRNPNEYPAVYGGKEPIYEMDPNAAPGTPFSGPLALRSVSSIVLRALLCRGCCVIECALFARPRFDRF